MKLDLRRFSNLGCLVGRLMTFTDKVNCRFLKCPKIKFHCGLVSMNSFNKRGFLDYAGLHSNWGTSSTMLYQICLQGGGSKVEVSSN